MKKGQIKPKRVKKCCICKKPFKPFSSTAKTCRLKCAIEKVRLDNELEKTKTRKELKKDDLKIRKAAAKKWCHLFIRLRDRGNNCICCNKPINDEVQAGHWKESANNPKVRYDEDNIHAQSLHCNYYKGGDSGDYESNLRKKIGDVSVDAIKTKLGGVVKRTADDYREIEKYYKEKIKLLENIDK